MFEVGDYVILLTSSKEDIDLGLASRFRSHIISKADKLDSGIIIESNNHNKWGKQRVKIRYFNRETVSGNPVESWTSTDFVEIDKQKMRVDKLKWILDDRCDGF